MSASVQLDRPGKKFGGDEGTRTPYLSDANAALSQMSYVPPQTNRPPLMVGSGLLARQLAIGLCSRLAYARCEDPRPMR